MTLSIIVLIISLFFMSLSDENVEDLSEIIKNIKSNKK